MGNGVGQREGHGLRDGVERSGRDIAGEVDIVAVPEDAIASAADQLIISGVRKRMTRSFH